MTDFRARHGRRPEEGLTTVNVSHLRQQVDDDAGVTFGGSSGGPDIFAWLEADLVNSSDHVLVSLRRRTQGSNGMAEAAPPVPLEGPS